METPWKTIFAAILLVMAIHLNAAANPEEYSRENDFNFDWRFQKGDFKEAANPQYDDTGWRKLNLPHDWSIEGPYDSNFASGTGYLPAGIGWYRKTFELNAPLKGKVIAVEFDGIYNNSEVWINGHYLGKRPYGYSSFQYDLTEYINFAPATNVIAVRVDHSQFADSRWYTGSGIYRNVRLRITEPLNIAHWGTYVTASVADDSNAQIKIETTVVNGDKIQRAFQFQSDIIDRQGRIVAGQTTSHTLAEIKDVVITHRLSVNSPKLWDVESPYLYQLKTTIKEADSNHSASSGQASSPQGEKIIDSTTTPFGIRSFRFDPAKGFFLNGRNIKIKGVCLHHDAGCVGAAVPAGMWKRRLELLKQIGANAIRTSHNPSSPEFLDLCDQMGFIVIEEAFDEFTPGKKKWIQGWNIGIPGKAGYNEVFDEWAVRDIEDMVRRDRNHPSIILWSIGNEIDYQNDPFSHPVLGKSYKPKNPPAENLLKYGGLLVKAVKRLDATRPVTASLANMQVSNAIGLAEILDVVSYNYQEKYYKKEHDDYPQRCILGGENNRTLPEWEVVEKNDYVSGQFVWIGFACLGEADAWPNKSWKHGLFDLCGFKKPQGWFRQSLWTTEPFVYIACQEMPADERKLLPPDWQALRSKWNWPNGKLMSVFCFTNCDEVELFLNGESVSGKSISKSSERLLNWRVPFRSGSLKAVGKRSGRAVCEYILQTANQPAGVKLIADKKNLFADGKDISHIEFQIVDANGIVVPDAEVAVKFSVSGQAAIIGIGNADPNSHESYQGTTHATWQGRGLLILQSAKQPGTVILRAEAQALEPDSITIDVK